MDSFNYNCLGGDYSSNNQNLEQSSIQTGYYNQFENECYQSQEQNNWASQNVFVSIPINPTQNGYKQLQIRQSEIKYEPIKFEQSSETGSLISNTNSPQKLTTNATSKTNLITARPKAVVCYKCKICPFITISCNCLNSHIKSCHPDGVVFDVPKKILCPGCENIFFKKQSLEIHLENDHQMKKYEIKLLLEATIKDQSSSIACNESSNKVQIDNIDFLPKTTCDNTVENIQIISDSDSSNNISDGRKSNDYTVLYQNNNLKEMTFNETSNLNLDNDLFMPAIDQDKNKIFIENVDTPIEPSIADNISIVNNFSNLLEKEEDTNKVFYDMDSGTMNSSQTEGNNPFPYASFNSEKPTRPKIYIKNVDILKEPIFVTSQAARTLNFNDDLSNLLSPNLDSPLRNFENINHSRENEIKKSEGKIYIKNVDIINQPNYHKKTTNSLHLRTVDELNLMNMNEVQDLIAPILAQDQCDSNRINKLSENLKNSDNSCCILPDMSDNANILFENNNSNNIEPWSNNCNLNELKNNKIDSETSNTENKNFNLLKELDFDLNTPQRFLNEEIEDDLLNCAEELMNDDRYGLENYPFLMSQRSYSSFQIENFDFRENENETLQHFKVDSAIPEKGRIYIAANLMENKSEKNEMIKKKTRGRPPGARQTGITKLKKNGLVVNVDEIGKKCDLDCGMRFRDIEKLQYHKKCHISSNLRRMQCPECKSQESQEFKSWNALHAHLWRSHNIDMELFSCDICDFRTPVLSYLNNIHRKIHFDDRNYKCNECNNSYKNKNQLFHHRRSHRPTVEHIQKCSECGATFTTIRALKRHIKKIHEKSKGNFKCEICQKDFYTKFDLKQHNLNHNPLHKFICDKCEYRSNDYNVYRRHKLTHDRNKMYTCKFCGYQCIQSHLYQKHLLRKHPKNAYEVILKCTYCTFATINQIKYNFHIARHQNELNTNENLQINENISVQKKSKDSFTENNAQQNSNQNKIKVKSNLVLTDPNKFYSSSPILFDNLENGIT